jgi:Ca2+-transporting ATPase
MPLIFGPVHIAFLEMVIDPVCSIVFEAEPAEDDIMLRSPRAATSPLFSPALVTWSLLQGAIAFVPLAALYVLALKRGLPETDARTLTFVSLVLVDLGLVLVNRSFATSLSELIGKANRALVWVATVTLSLLALAVISPVGRELFRFGPLHADDLMLVAGIVVAVLATLEFLKRFWRARLVT